MQQGVCYALLILLGISIVSASEHTNSLFLRSEEKTPSNDQLFDFPGCLLASMVVFGGALLCAGAGVGGGAFNLVAYITFLGLGAHSAVPLSKATILGVAIGSYLVMWRKRHPSADRPLIDYNTTLLMEPLTLVGTVLGVLMNVSFPEILIVVGLVLLLSITAYKTFQKGYTAYKKENATKNKETKRENTKLIVKEEAAIQAPDDLPPPAVNSTYDIQGDYLMESEAEKFLRSEKNIPWAVALGLVITWAIFITALFVAGAHTDSLVGVKCGSVWFYLTLGAAFFFLTAVTLLQAYRLSLIQKHKAEINYPFAEGDVRWEGYKPYVFPSFCIAAGWAAGFFGVGGGLVAGPILLQLGMQGQVATSTAGFMILFTASSTTIQYSLLGLIPWELGLWYGCMAFMGAVLGQIALSELIKRTGRQSYAVFMLGVLEVVSMLAIGGLGIKDIVDVGSNLDFQWICYS